MQVSSCPSSLRETKQLSGHSACGHVLEVQRLLSKRLKKKSIVKRIVFVLIWRWEIFPVTFLTKAFIWLLISLSSDPLHESSDAASNIFRFSVALLVRLKVLFWNRHKSQRQQPYRKRVQQWTNLAFQSYRISKASIRAEAVTAVIRRRGWGLHGNQRDAAEAPQTHPGGLRLGCQFLHGTKLTRVSLCLCLDFIWKNNNIFSYELCKIHEHKITDKTLKLSFFLLYRYTKHATATHNSSKCL